MDDHLKGSVVLYLRIYFFKVIITVFVQKQTS